MYFVFQSEIRDWRNKTLQAELQGERSSFPEYKPHWWKAQPLIVPLPHFTFSVDAKAPFLDNYWTGTEFDLYSDKLISELYRVGIRFETFPVTVVDRRSKMTVPIEYRIFHLLESYSGIDMDRSDTDQYEIRKLVITKQCSQEKILMFRDLNLSNLVLIHQSLKDILDEADVTGCSYIPIEAFQVIRPGPRSFKLHGKLPG